MSKDTKACDHHWHHAGSGVDHARNEQWKRSICCHCGNTNETRTPLYGGGSVTYGDTKDCGPFKPDTRVWF